MRKGDSMDSPSGGFAILYQLQSRGGVPQETPRPLGKTARYQNHAMHASTTTLWVQNRSLRDCRQAGRQRSDRDHSKTRAIAFRPLCGNMGLLLRPPGVTDVLGTGDRTPYERDPRTLGAGRLSRWLNWLFCWYRACLTETSIVILSELAY